MAVTTTRRRTTSSITKYWGMVKDLDDSMKLELISLLAESIKPAKEITTGRQNKKRAHHHGEPDFFVCSPDLPTLSSALYVVCWRRDGRQSESRDS